MTNYVCKVKNSKAVDVFDDKGGYVRSIEIRSSDGAISMATINGTEFHISTNVKVIVYDDHGRWLRDI